MEALDMRFEASSEPTGELGGALARRSTARSVDNRSDAHFFAPGRLKAPPRPRGKIVPGGGLRMRLRKRPNARALGSRELMVHQLHESLLRDLPGPIDDPEPDRDAEQRVRVGPPGPGRDDQREDHAAVE